jgi:HSP20 family protein
MLTPASSFFRNDPFAQLERMTRDVDRMFPGNRSNVPSFPAVNVWRGDDAVAITSELPGVELDDIEITVKENVFTLSGERKAPEVPQGARWQLRERSYGKFSRAVRLPFMVDAEKVEARFRDGVLQVALHRPEADKPRRIEVRAE